MACDFCGSKRQPAPGLIPDADNGIQKFEALLCPDCSSGSLIPQPEEEVLDRYYESSYYGLGTGKFLPIIQKVFEFSTQLLARNIRNRCGFAEGRVLDIGCGRAVLLRQMAEAGFCGIGLERKGTAPEMLKSSIVLREGEIWEQGFTDEYFDIVVIWHVLEHLRDPCRVLREVKSVLKPNGMLVIAVPNNASFQARVFGRRWFHLDVPRHLHFFSYPALLTQLKADDYNIDCSHTFDLLQGVYGFLQSTLNFLFPRCPNRLYVLLRRKMSLVNFMEIGLWAIPTTLILPFAVLESVVSALFNRGPCAVYFARKKIS
jgi:SAM-dependent methyltransferase